MKEGYTGRKYHCILEASKNQIEFAEKKIKELDKQIEEGK